MAWHLLKCVLKLPTGLFFLPRTECFLYLIPAVYFLYWFVQTNRRFLNCSSSLIVCYLVPRASFFVLYRYLAGELLFLTSPGIALDVLWQIGRQRDWVGKYPDPLVVQICLSIPSAIQDEAVTTIPILHVSAPEFVWLIYPLLLFCKDYFSVVSPQWTIAKGSSFFMGNTLLGCRPRT